MKTFYIISAFAVALLLAGCEKQNVPYVSDQSVSAAQTDQHDSVSIRSYNDSVRLEIGNTEVRLWVGCTSFRAADTTIPLKHTNGVFNELYWSKNGFKENVMGISEIKPGEENYNGGRWHLNVLKLTVNPAKYSDACSYEALDLNDFESKEIYFSCPLVPVISRPLKRGLSLSYKNKIWQERFLNPPNNAL